jgi:hypothetical protein
VDTLLFIVKPHRAMLTRGARFKLCAVLLGRALLLVEA